MTPSTVKHLVCLANSRKRTGRCIAGKEIVADGSVGGWIRPVSDRENEEVSERERQYADGSDPRILDVVEAPLLSPRPKDYQSENWLLDSDRYWKLISKVGAVELTRFVDPKSQL